jgi:serine/threonine protein kinase
LNGEEKTVTESRIGSAFGKYEIKDLLGKGGMGEVYRAYDTEKRRTVALKILLGTYAHDSEYRERFLRESHAAARLSEPHSIPIHDYGTIDDQLYIDMRLVQGRTLQDLIDQGPLDPQRAVGIIDQVAAALDAAHAEQLVHRDVKPQNILVTAADFAYLVDFGIAKDEADTRLTMAGSAIGSFAYMAPERFEDAPTTPAVDTYSLTCVLYECLTSAKPFAANSQNQLIAAHLSAPPPQPSLANHAVPQAMDTVIARGMAKEPDDRYGSCGALARAAQRALQGGPPTGSQTATVTAPPSWPADYTRARPYPVSAPVPAGTPGTGSGESASRRWLIPAAIISVIAAALLGGIGVVIGQFAAHNSTSPPSAPPATNAATLPPADRNTEPTESTTADTSTAESTTAQASDPEATSLERLRELAAGDRPYVSEVLADRWVPQLSSKRPGVVDDGIVWDNPRTLQEHLALRSRYGAKLLWSGDWSTFSAPDFWVTIVPATFSDSSGALAWCRSRSLDSDHCLAKLVSTTHDVAGSTAEN